MNRDSTKDAALLVLRLSGLGLVFAHGWGKIGRLTGENADQFISSIGALGFPIPVVFAWAATLSEVVGGSLIALGLFTRVAAAFAAFTVFVAAFFRHKFPIQLMAWLGLNDASPEDLASLGNPERALMYLLIFLALAFMGGGRFSLDHIRRKRR